MIHQYIAIEGPIGVGKTSFATRLAADFDGKLILEEFADNPFLPKFYENPSRYGFPLEMSFLAERFMQFKMQGLMPEIFPQFTVSDYFFSKSMIYAGVNLAEDEFRLYLKIFQVIYQFLPKPSLLVYLHNNITNLKNQISKRGRSYEMGITEAYLASIDQAYWRYFNLQPDLKILALDVTYLDFIRSPKHYDLIINKIEDDYPTGITRIALYPPE